MVQATTDGRQQIRHHPQYSLLKSRDRRQKTNHSVRRTTIRRLHDSGVPPTKLMQLSGHRNVQSVNHYEVNSLEDQRHMSEILSRGSRSIPSTSSSTETTAIPQVRVENRGQNSTAENIDNAESRPAISHATLTSRVSNVIASTASQNPIASAVGGIFGTATYINCTINVAVNIGGSTFPQSPKRKRRRVAVIYDSSDDS